LFYAHAETLNGQRTFVLLGGQRHLTFVADVEGFRDPMTLRSLAIDELGLYPHLVDAQPSAGLPSVHSDESPARPHTR